MSARSLAVACLAVVVSAGAIGVLANQHPAGRLVSGSPTTRPTTAAMLACPGTPPSPTPSGSAPPTTLPVTSVQAVSPTSSNGSGGAGRLVISGPEGASGPTSTRAGALVSTLLGDPSQSQVPTATVVQARGALAAGASAFQTMVGSVPTQQNGKPPAKPPAKPPVPSGSISAVGCQAPRTDWWFTGASTAVDSTSILVLSNPGPSVAVVGLSIASAQGPVQAPGAHAIALPPHGNRVFDLAQWAPGRTDLSLHILASRGVVSAGIQLQRVIGATPAGAEWLPPSDPPATSVVVGAGTPGSTAQTLIVANPGQRQLVVSATVLSPSGAFASTHLAAMQVPPGTVLERPLAGVVLGGANAIELDANGPVTGAIESRLVSGTRDFSLTGVGPDLSSDPSQPTVVPLVAGSRFGLAFAVQTKTPATVRVDGFTAAGSPVSSAMVSLAGRSTTTWTPPDASAGGKPSASGTPAYYAVTVVRVGSTDLGGSGISCVAQYTKAGGLASLPLTPAVWTVRRPAILP